jgi:patatin-like phospholipase/acyl hydrolase
MPKENHYRILSFDGGGLRGLISLGVLKRLSAELGGDEWFRNADLYAGTSTGGLIALALASGKSIDDITSFYTGYGPDIFNRSSLYYISSVFKFLHAGYRNVVLERQLTNMFGEKKLDDLRKKVVLTSFDLSTRGKRVIRWAPKIFHNFEGDDQDKNLLRNVGLYTSAAPTYLPSVDGYVDGGVCANNPSMCALAQVLDPRNEIKRDISEVRLISVGTGENPISVRKKRVRWGILGWNTRLLSMIMSGPVGIAHFQCKNILTESRYRRIQVEMKENIEMDDASKIPELISIPEKIDNETIENWAEWIRRNWN